MIADRPVKFFADTAPGVCFTVGGKVEWVRIYKRNKICHKSKLKYDGNIEVYYSISSTFVYV